MLCFWVSDWDQINRNYGFLIEKMDRFRLSGILGRYKLKGGDHLRVQSGYKI
jgi:hypothetical protein